MTRRPPTPRPLFPSRQTAHDSRIYTLKIVCGPEYPDKVGGACVRVCVVVGLKTGAGAACQRPAPPFVLLPTAPHRPLLHPHQHGLRRPRRHRVPRHLPHAGPLAPVVHAGAVADRAARRDGGARQPQAGPAGGRVDVRVSQNACVRESERRREGGAPVFVCVTQETTRRSRVCVSNFMIFSPTLSGFCLDTCAMKG